MTAEVLDGGGELSRGGTIVHEGSLGGVGGQSTGGTVVVNGGYTAQVPKLPEPTPPDAAVLLSLHARWLGAGEVALDWETGVEFDLLGFQIERQTISGDWVRTHAGMIPAWGGGRPNRYSFVESDVPDASQARYRLLAVNLSGELNLLSEAIGRVALQAGIALTPTGLMISVRGAGGGRAIVEATTDVARGPWVPSAELYLDANGNGLLSAAVDDEGPVRFYRVRQE
jgi:hypothetical protein